MDIIDVPLLRAVPHNHQVENHEIGTRRWAKVGELKWAKLEELLEGPPTLWINSDHTKEGSNNCMSPEEAATQSSSLVLIKPDDFIIAVDRNYWTGNKTCRAKFDHNNAHYNFSLTDPIAYNVYKSKDEGDYRLDDVFLCISLTERYEQDGRCHKLVAAVFQNPPL